MTISVGNYILPWGTNVHTASVIRIITKVLSSLYTEITIMMVQPQIRLKQIDHSV